MNEPELHRVYSGKERTNDKALVFIPGMCSEYNSIVNPTTEALANSGWDGEVYYLWWDSSKMDTMVKYIMRGLIPGMILFLKKVEKDAKRTGRDYLPSILKSELRGKKITFVAHSMGAFMLYKLFKKPDKYPISNTIEDVILLGGAVKRSKEKWRNTKFNTLFNVYNENDKVLKGWKYLYRPITLHEAKSPCGLHLIKEKHLRNVDNINVSDLLGNSHKEYYKVFNNMLKYNGKKWTTDSSDKSICIIVALIMLIVIAFAGYFVIKLISVL